MRTAKSGIPPEPVLLRAVAGASAEPSRTAFIHSRSRGVWRGTPVFTKRRASRGHSYARATALVWNELDSVGRVRAEYRCDAQSTAGVRSIVPNAANRQAHFGNAVLGTVYAML